MTTFAQRIDAALKYAKDTSGLTQDAVGKKAGLGQGQISKLRVGSRARSTKTYEIAQACGVNPEWLATGKGQMIGALNAAEPSTPYETNSFRPLLSWEHDEELPPGEVVAIPRLGISLSAGHGYEQPEIELVKDRPQIFSADWIRRKRLQPKALRVMYAEGNSMEPRIQDGDALVVDLSQTAIVDGRVYAMYYSGGERVKRLTIRPAGGLIIASDNDREHPIINLTAEEANSVRIIGRIVNTSGDKGL